MIASWIKHSDDYISRTYASTNVKRDENALSSPPVAHTMDLAKENAAKIYQLPIRQVKEKLPEIFRRLRRPNEQEGQWVQEYVVC